MKFYTIDGLWKKVEHMFVKDADEKVLRNLCVE